jgi:hypothetical protein
MELTVATLTGDLTEPVGGTATQERQWREGVGRRQYFAPCGSYWRASPRLGASQRTSPLPLTIVFFGSVSKTPETVPLPFENRAQARPVYCAWRPGDAPGWRRPHSSFCSPFPCMQVAAAWRRLLRSSPRACAAANLKSRPCAQDQGPTSREPQRSHRGRALRASAASWPTACGSGFRGGNQVAAPRHRLMLTGSAYAAAPLLRRGPCHAKQQICKAKERMRRQAVATRRRGGYHAPQGGREKEQSP